MARESRLSRRVAHEDEPEVTVTRAAETQGSEPVEPKKREKVDPAIIEAVSAANVKLANADETDERISVLMEGGKPRFWWTRPVKLRELTEEEQVYLNR